MADAVNQVVGQHEIDMAIDVRVGAKVLMVASRVSLADAMRVYLQDKPILYTSYLRCIYIHRYGYTIHIDIQL